MPTSLSPYDRKHRLHLRQIERQVDKLYQEAVDRAVRIGISLHGFDRSKPFSFKSKAITDKKAEQLVEWLRQGLEQTISKGVADSWSLSNTKNDAIVSSLFGSADKLPDIVRRRYYNKNGEAERAFLQRRQNGLGLSDNVWRYSNQFRNEVELGLDLGIRSGRSASQMSRDIRIYLQNPDKLYRRIRKVTEDGKEVYSLSQRARMEHPGAGVYRSSYKNALRLAVTETNMAYRAADHERWQQFDFVKGIRIQLSENHGCVGVEDFVDICDELAGEYPKEFKFTGWHPFCRCLATPILVSEDEMVAHKEAFLRGEDYEFKQRNIEEMPSQFREWEKRNAKRIEDARKRGTLPYFLKDNENVIKSKKLTTLEKAKLHHEARTQEMVDDIKARAGARQDRLALERSLGIKQGEPMTFEQANAMRGNPHYLEGKQYRINCQSAVIANEMRRRGWDVEAYGNNGDRLYTPAQLAFHTEAAWLDINGEVPASREYKRAIKHNAYVGSIAKFTSRIEEDLVVGARYHVHWGWQGHSNCGHIIIAEKLTDGTVRWYDPQNGKLLNIRNRLLKARTENGVYVLRVDNLQPNVPVVEGVVKAVGTQGDAPRITGASMDFWLKDIHARSNSNAVVSASPLTEYKNSIRKDSSLLPTTAHLQVENMRSGDLRMGGTARKNLINHCNNEETVEAAIHTWNCPDGLRFERRSELAENKDMTNPVDARNIQKKIDRGVEYYNLYEMEYAGSKWRVFVEVLRNGQEQLHSIYKKGTPSADAH